MNKQILTDIQSYLNKKEVDAVLISRTDSFLSEYFPPYKDRLKEVTGGFTGSAGLAVVSLEKKALFVDSRYTDQAKQQSDFDVYEVPTETTLSEWLKEHFYSKKIGFNSWTHSYAWFKKLKKTLSEAQIELIAMDEILFEKWFGQDSFDQTDVFEYDLSYAGEHSQDKLKRVSHFIQMQECDAFVCCSPENISWVLNKRAKTVGEYPVVFERGIIDKESNYTPFTKETLPFLKNKRIGLDFSKTPFIIFDELQKKGMLEDISDPIDLLKSCKNDVEIKNIKDACLSESKTICRFLVWVEQQKELIDELMCDEKLKQLRSEDSLYFSDSFQTIAASGEHAALAHYTANSTTNRKICENAMLLVDTGGHYYNGTTDMTRTICIAEPTDLMKRRYTQVLKGHIALSVSSLKKGETTAFLDEQAHQFLRADKVDYWHATGHGIGLMLGVHEMPPIVHEKDTTGICDGMIFSNEPAYYSQADGFGIRLENMLLAVSFDEISVSFENLLFIPFDYRLIDFSLLTVDEKKWLNIYHHQIIEKVFPLLSVDEQIILQPFVKAFE